MFSWYNIFEPQVAAWESAQDMSKLLTGLIDSDPEVRCLAYDAVGRLKATYTLKAVVDSIAKEDMSAVRARGAIALGKIGGFEAKEALQYLLRDPDTEVRASAVRALSDQADSELLPVFCNMLEDEHEDVVVEAIYAIGNLGSHRAVSSLHKLFSKYGKAIREIASSAIYSINLKQKQHRPDEVYFFTYARGASFFCECYSYKLLAWRNYLRRRWRYPFARDWGIGYWEIETLGEHLKAEVMRPGLDLCLIDHRS
ncbi:MAG: HEAT repeat domain-containing protein [Blastocatellia bacterium]|nr:HEAT repeat domain-containing protein [Blastocatellia bacterium]